ncbi:MAG: cation diffusion facilitator family transporter [Patescibacteria group bacterium]
MKEKIASLSILANIFLAAGKVSVGLLTNSAAILAAGVDSLVDIFSSTVSFVGIKIAGKPADEKHPYGHYKFEVLGGVVIVILILVTGIGIIYDSVKGLFEPEMVELGYLAFGVMIASTVVNEVMARLKIYYGKKENSVGLISDGFHSRLDVYTSLVILLGLILTRYWIYADSVIAILMGLYIVKEAYSIGKDTVGSLLDVAADEETEKEIKEVVQKHNVELESLKTQKKGSAITANLEIKLAGDLSVEEASKVSEDLRSDLVEKVESLQYVAIQIKSHEVTTSYFKPEFRRGFGWRRKGAVVGSNEKERAVREGGYCVCKNCGYREPHKRGVPCKDVKCPECGEELRRE